MRAKVYIEITRDYGTRLIREFTEEQGMTWKRDAYSKAWSQRRETRPEFRQRFDRRLTEAIRATLGR